MIIFSVSNALEVDVIVNDIIVAAGAMYTFGQDIDTLSNITVGIVKADVGVVLDNIDAKIASLQATRATVAALK